MSQNNYYEPPSLNNFIDNYIHPIRNRITQILDICGIDYEIFKKSSNPQKTDSPIGMVIQFDIDQYEHPINKISGVENTEKQGKKEEKGNRFGYNPSNNTFKC
jgi:hypothetical protein